MFSVLPSIVASPIETGKEDDDGCGCGCVGGCSGGGDGDDLWCIVFVISDSETLASATAIAGVIELVALILSMALVVVVAVVVVVDVVVVSVLGAFEDCDGVFVDGGSLLFTRIVFALSTLAVEAFISLLMLLYLLDLFPLAFEFVFIVNC